MDIFSAGGVQRYPAWNQMELPKSVHKVHGLLLLLLLLLLLVLLLCLVK